MIKKLLSIFISIVILPSACEAWTHVNFVPPYSPLKAILSMMNSPSSPPEFIKCEVCGGFAKWPREVSWRLAFYEHPGCAVKRGEISPPSRS